MSERGARKLRALRLPLRVLRATARRRDERDRADATSERESPWKLPVRCARRHWSASTMSRVLACWCVGGCSDGNSSLSSSLTRSSRRRSSSLLVAGARLSGARLRVVASSLGRVEVSRERLVTRAARRRRGARRAVPGAAGAVRIVRWARPLALLAASHRDRLPLSRALSRALSHARARARSLSLSLSVSLSLSLSLSLSPSHTRVHVARRCRGSASRAARCCQRPKRTPRRSTRATPRVA